ncbi:MAG: hypothetical protein ACKOYP_14860, partial [Bacteroidota bacterium]
MIVFFRSGTGIVYAVSAAQQPGQEDLAKLCWLFFRGEYLPERTLKGYFHGPRKEMITPWSTNAVEITQNMGIAGISRIEELHPVQGADAPHDRM